MGFWELLLSPFPTYGLAIAAVLTLWALSASCKRKRKPGEPPLVNGWIPFLGVALDFRKNASKLLLDLQQKHGDVFTVYLAGKYITFITNPLQYGSLTKHGKHFTFEIISDTLASKVFDYPSTLSSNFPNMNENVHRQYQYLQGKSLDVLSDSMMKNLQCVFEERFACRTGWETKNLNKFCLSAIFEASFITLYGRNSNADTQNVFDAIGDQFTKFDANFSYLVANIPIALLGVTKRMRKELIHYFLPRKMAAWLEVSELIQARKDMLEMYETLGDYDKAAHHFAFMWASVGNTIPASFWTTYHLLRHPEALAAVRDEIDHLLQSTGQERRPGYSIRLTREQLDNLVYLESAINEALRFCSASMSVRFVKEDFVLKLEENQEYSLRKSDLVAIFPPILHMDPEVYEDPKKYKFDRYVENGKKKTSFYKQKHKLKYFLMPFGYGSNICPGRFFAMNEIKLFLVLMLSYFDVEMAEEKEVALDKSRLGLGILLPDSDILFRYRLRP